MAEHGESPQALKSWWAGFKKGGKKKPEPPPEDERVVFGVPLQEGIKYANVAISLLDERGQSFIYGYVPIVVAKCGVFLKEKATDVEGIFRLSGSAKRINELKQVFDSPPKYGKGLDWTGYTVHDAANVFRRYLNMLPQPIVPLQFYEKFREPLRGHQAQAPSDNAAPAQAPNFTPAEHEKAIVTYQRLITEIPDLNRQLLLYVLDLLSVFASKSDVNRMTSANLSAIFQPGMLSHPDHNLSPPDYKLSQDVILFLIDNQDSFLIGMTGTAANEQTVRDVQNASAVQPGTPAKSAQAGIGRSVSNASAGAESLRKFGGVRRNLSVSSKNSKHSSNAQTPNTPQSGGFGGAGVHRSNTVPSKRSPALSSTRGVRGVDSPTASVALSPGLAPPGVKPLGAESAAVAAAAAAPTIVQSASTPPVDKGFDKDEKKDGETARGEHLTVENPPPHKRKTSALLVKNPSSDGKDGRAPNKLRKKRAPTDTQRSANSSSHSLSNADYIESLPTPNSFVEKDPMSSRAPRIGDGLEEAMGPSTLDAAHQQHSEQSQQTLKAKSPPGSVRSKSSLTDLSEHDNNDGTKGEKKRRWRFSSAARKHDASDASPQRLGGNANAGKSAASMTSASKSRQSLANDGAAGATPLEAVQSETTQPSTASEASGQREKETDEEGKHKRGLLSRIKDKVEKSRQEHKEREAEKERAKSPPPRDYADRTSSKHSLSVIAQTPSSRNRSIDANAQPPPVPLPTDQLPTGKAAAATVAGAHAPATTYAPAATHAPFTENLPVPEQPLIEAPTPEKTAVEAPAAERVPSASGQVEAPEETPLAKHSPTEDPIAEQPAAEKKAEQETPAPDATAAQDIAAKTEPTTQLPASDAPITEAKTETIEATPSTTGA